VTAIAPMALTYARGLIDTLHERVGNEEQLLGDPEFSDDGGLKGVWGRGIYREVSHKSDLGIYGTGPSFKMDSWAVQAGADLYRDTSDNGNREHIGIYGAYGEIDGDVTHNLLDQTFAGGKVWMEGYTLAGYWTHFEPEGAYLDGVVQATWLDIHASTPRIETKSTTGFDFAASLEGGYPFELDEDWTLEPQGQLIYQALSIERTEDVAAQIDFRDLDSFTGRIGLRLNHEGDKGFWVRLNLWHEFTGEPVTEFSSADGPVPFTAQLPSTWGEIDGGVSLKLDRRTTLFGAGSYQTTFDGDTHGWDAKIGLRRNW